MTIAFICVAMLLLSGLFICYRENDVGYYRDSLILFLAGVVATIGGLVGMVALAALSLEYTGATYKAAIINREYGTEYTQQEVFYASDVINIVRELDRRRIEINGDIRRQRDPERNLPKPDNR